MNFTADYHDIVQCLYDNYYPTTKDIKDMNILKVQLGCLIHFTAGLIMSKNINAEELKKLMEEKK